MHQGATLAELYGGVESTLNQPALECDMKTEDSRPEIGIDQGNVSFLIGMYVPGAWVEGRAKPTYLPTYKK